MDSFFSNLFFANQDTITWWTMCLRTCIIFFISIILIRVGGKRIFGKLGAFDIVVSIMLGTILARAISGNSKFLPTILACFVLVFLHRVFALLAFSHPFWSKLIKGESARLIIDGKMNIEEMKLHNISEGDIREALRIDCKIDDFSKIKDAYLERSGRISIILKSA